MTTVAEGERGQALIEFIIFLPFMLLMYTMVQGLGDAINGSINQQKALRGYYFYRLQNNAHVTRPGEGAETWNSFGMFFIGWADFLEGGRTPVYPCYRINLPFTPADGDECNETYSDPTTQFIRVGTAYGICGATYARSENNPTLHAEQPAGTQDLAMVLSTDGCLIR